MTDTDTPAIPGPAHPAFAARPFQGVADALFKGICQAAAILVLVLAGLLAAVLIWKSWLAIETIGPRFVSGLTWDPEPNHRQFGALPFIWGTLATSAIAMFIAVPLGVGTAAFLAEIAPHWLRRAGSFLVEMLAVVPSVVYGFWGLFVLAPVLQRIITFLGGPETSGLGIFPAGLILSIMIVPYVASVSYDVIRAVPRSQREGALALGCTRWQTIWHVILPYARPGIVGGAFLALGRALGETMAVTMLIGNTTSLLHVGDSTFLNPSPLAWGNSIASVIANQFTEADYDLYLSALVELGLVLLLVTVIINSLARVLIWRVSRGPSVKRGAWRVKAHGLPSVGFPAPSIPVAVVNRLMTGVLALCLVITVGFLAFIMGHLLIEGLEAIDFNFFTKLPRPIGQKGGGVANALYGSFLLVGLATLFAVPLGLLAAIYLAEHRSGRLGSAVRFVGELLGGVPSIVIGIFAYVVVVKPMGHFSGWAGAFALGIMMIPIVMRASEEALKLVPASLRQASYALGAARWQTVVRVVVPAALPSIITAVFLAIARVAGETAPLIMTAFGNQFWPRTPNDPTPALPLIIWNYAISHDPNWHRLAWAAALVLVVLVMLLNFGIRLAAGKRVVLASQAD
jgi:phosphate transport system permease protein